VSWMQQLEKVYNNNSNLVGDFEEKNNQRTTLLPISHVMQSAQIEVLISPEGEFITAKAVEKEYARTIVPVTLASANRTSASAPHYLHDKLCYVAGDYIPFGGNEKRASYYVDYIKQMEKWMEDKEVPQRVQAIYQYVSKGTLISDLVKESVLYIDEQQRVINKWNDKDKPLIYQVVTGDVLDAFVRFDVLHTTPKEPVVWEDKSLFEAFIAYFGQQYDGNIGMCYVSGQSQSLTMQHGSRIRNAGDMAKLISANDKDGYTFRGRFATSTEAVQIGYMTSQKAHHALSWLIQRQGTNIGSRYFVAFGVEKTELLNLINSSNELFPEDVDDEVKKANTEEFRAAEIRNAVQGYKIYLKEKEVKNIIVMALDSTTTGIGGRLAIVYYQSFHVDLFLENISHWFQTCRWWQFEKDESSYKMKRFIGTPSTYRIVEAVYGSKADAKIKKQLYTRLLPCIVERKPIPKDIVRLIFNRVKNPESFKGLMESWEGTLNIACALVLKQYTKEGYKVALQEDKQKRDYLFGRLLGVAEVMERRMLNEREEKRATNATRYFNAFSQRPARTWLVIRRQLQPYFMRLGANGNVYAELMQTIEQQITLEKMNNEPLDPVFLIGYSSQIQDMYKKKEETVHENA